jgi:membrane-associated protein
VALCLGAGYLFGNIPVVKENFSLVALGIVLVSLMPMGVEYLRQKRRNAGTLAQKWSRSSDLPPGQD